MGVEDHTAHIGSGNRNMLHKGKVIVNVIDIHGAVGKIIKVVMASRNDILRGPGGIMKTWEQQWHRNEQEQGWQNEKPSLQHIVQHVNTASFLHSRVQNRNHSNSPGKSASLTIDASIYSDVAVLDW